MAPLAIFPELHFLFIPLVVYLNRTAWSIKETSMSKTYAAARWVNDASSDSLFLSKRIFHVVCLVCAVLVACCVGEFIYTVCLF
jgi:hypothetical protein